MVWGNPPPFSSLRESLLDPKQPIGMRMRATYYLRQAYKDAAATTTTAAAVVKKDVGMHLESIIKTLTSALLLTAHGSLLRHEFAFVMGQLRDERSCSVLEQVLLEPNDCVMVRHECAEALGAIGASRSQTVLERVLHDDKIPHELSETCQLALNMMEWRVSGIDHTETIPDKPVCACMLNPYSSVDPAPPHPAHANMPWTELGDLLCDPEAPVFERYRAMFSLRNRGGSEAVQQLCRALVEDNSSALLRHEVAYVLGQMQHPAAISALESSLRRVDEHSMVRHESAEALGAIEGEWETVQSILEEFCLDSNDIVRESCLVALDAADYWGHNQVLEDIPQRDEEVMENLMTVKSRSLPSFAQHKALDNPLMIEHFNIQK